MAKHERVYYGSWDSYEDMKNSFYPPHGAFSLEHAHTPFPKPEEVLYAAYGTLDYGGAALVVFTRNEELWEANGCHCSCYGLEDQWGAERTTWAALLRRELLNDHDEENEIALHRLCAKHIGGNTNDQ